MSEFVIVGDPAKGLRVGVVELYLLQKYWAPTTSLTEKVIFSSRQITCATGALDVKFRVGTGGTVTATIVSVTQPVAVSITSFRLSPVLNVPEATS